MIENDSRNPMRRSTLDNLSAHLFHHVAEMHAGRTCCLARATVQTAKHVFDKRICNLGPAFIKGPHQVNAAAWRIHFTTEYTVGRTRRETKAAMDTVEIKRWFVRVLA